MNIISSILSGGVEGVFSGIGELAKDIRSAITGDPTPEKQAEIQQNLMELEFAVKKAQTDINLQEAKHPNIFVSGWRPFIGWICGLAIFYNFIFNPFLMWILKIYAVKVMPPPLDTGSLMTLVMSLLGLGGMRTYEKFKNVSGKH